MSWSKNQIKVLLKKMTGYKAADSAKFIVPVARILEYTLKDDDKIIAVEMHSQIGLSPCVFILLQNRILYIQDKVTHELYIENIASFQKEQLGIMANIKISDAGNKSFDFKGFNLKTAETIICFLQKKLDIDKVIAENEDLPLFVEDYKTTLLRCCFGGFLGLHRFYTGYNWSAFFQIILLLFWMPGFIIWWMIDAIAIITGHFKTADGFGLSNNNGWGKKLIIAPALLSVIFLIIFLQRPESTLLNQVDNFTINELNSTMRQANSYQSVSGASFPALYKDSVKVKGIYKSGYFKLTAPENGYKKYAVVCNCSQKTIIPFWQGFYTSDGTLFQEFNYIKTKEVQELSNKTNSNLMKMWNSLCQSN